MKKIFDVNIYDPAAVSDGEDSGLLESLRAGDESAYRKLYDKHYTVLCHIAFNYLKDDFLARSMVDETIFHFWEIRQTVQVRTSLRMYLISAVKNRCLNYIRKVSLENSKCVSSTLMGEISEYLDDKEHPLGRLLEQELEHQIMKAVDDLPSCTRRVFELSRFGNKKYSEIASLLGISVNTVKYHISQALSILTDKLSQYL